MNFLAHAWLAGERDTLRIGGVIGDFVKGPLPGALCGDLVQGVALHRAIDSYAEQHPAFIRSRARVSPSRRRVAGILVDMFYDHLLARDWASYAQVPLTAFKEEVYCALMEMTDLLPEAAKVVMYKMRTQDWLGSYSELTEVGRAIDKMAIYRLRRATTLAGGIAEFQTDPEGFSSDCRQFMLDAKVFAARWLAANTSSG